MGGLARSAQRVAGNALFGLYRLGDTRAIEGILQMAIHSEPRFRASAAWVMGDSADPRFLTTLGRMLADSDGVVRTRAFRSVAIIRRRSSELTQKGQIHVHLWEARRLANGNRRLRLAVVETNDTFPSLPATQYLVTEGTQAVTEYEVRRRPPVMGLAVGFCLPRGIDAKTDGIGIALLECLGHKRSAHLWGIVHYDVSAPPPELPQPARFSAGSATLTSLI